MTNEIIPQTTSTDLTAADAMKTMSVYANEAAANNVFADYLSRKATNTIRAQGFDLKVFADFLFAAGNPYAKTDDLQHDPNAWVGCSWGIVEGFVKWQLDEGYSVTSVNRRLSTVKTYAKLATKAGVLSTEDLALIKTVNGYGQKEAKRVNEKRTTTNKGRKKAEPILIDREQAEKLIRDQPETPQGRRDAVIMALLLDHGLRCGEVATLNVTDFNMKDGTFQLYRPKVDKTQTHRMTQDTLWSIREWFESGDCPAVGPLLRGSRKGGALTDAGMSTTAISERVRSLASAIGIEGMSAHDCRHYWATRWAGKVDVLRLQEAGGWNSLAMPRRYVEHAKIANEGMS